MKEKKEKLEEKAVHKEKKKDIVEVRPFWGTDLEVSGRVLQGVVSLARCA